MDHTIALQTQAAERYVLGDMPEEERDAFEEHYFSCQICADDLRELSAFVENAKVVLQSPPEPWPLRAAAAPLGREVKVTGWRTWLRPPVLVGALSAVFAAVLVVNFATIQRLDTPLMNPAVVLKAETRDRVPAFAEGAPISVVLTLVDGPAPGSPIQAEIQSESGTVKTVAATAPEENQALNFVDPHPKLKAGNYNLVISGKKYPFQVVKK